MPVEDSSTVAHLHWFCTLKFKLCLKCEEYYHKRAKACHCKDQ